MNDMNEKLLDHDYDGIKELDNDLPRWWVWLFYLTIIFAVLYMFYFHILGIGYLSADEYRQEVDPSYVRINAGESRLLGLAPIYRSPLSSPERDVQLKAGISTAVAVYKEEKREHDTATYVAYADPDQIAAGGATFQRLCFTCHGKAGEGGIGPNLTDDYWLHGGDFSEIVKTIKYGVPTKGMVAWRMDLKPDQILQVASFVKSLHGSNPPNPKPPQGDLYKP
jgi:cytochrome c oxidase cbb3-type subunit 3